MGNNKLQSVIIDDKYYIDVIDNELKIRNITDWTVDIDCVTNFVDIELKNAAINIALSYELKNNKPIALLGIRTIYLGNIDEIIELTNKIELVFDKNVKYTLRDIIMLSNMCMIADKKLTFNNVEIDMTSYRKYKLTETFNIKLRMCG